MRRASKLNVLKKFQERTVYKNAFRTLNNIQMNILENIRMLGSHRIRIGIQLYTVFIVFGVNKPLHRFLLN